MIEETPLQQFLDELASQSSTPGGGSAAAIMGAMGAALVSMVCNLTIGKPNYAEVGELMTDTLARAEALRTRLIELVQADIRAFDAVMAAYALPRQTETEKQQRSARIQDALKGATEAPLECAQACADIITLSRIVAEQGNRNVVSDAGVAVLAAQAALRSAALNVQINIKAIKDREFTARASGRLESILASVGQDCEDIYQQVWDKL
ncbi:MAG: methenyltetrahydrofolate cyclohydrolase [Methylococcus sp.]